MTQPEGAHLAPPDFTTQFLAAWSAARERFFKIERKQSYNQAGDESYKAFLRGDHETSLRLLRDELLTQRGMYDEALAHGVELIRLRQVEEPLSDYLRYFEIPSYFISEELGEKIYFVHPDPNVDELPDCIIFDSAVMFVNTYDGLDRLGGAIVVTDQEQIRKAITLGETLLSKAEPLAQYAAAHNL